MENHAVSSVEETCTIPCPRKNATTQPKTQKIRGFIKIRNIVKNIVKNIKNNILNIRKEVTLAASLRKIEQQPQHYKAMELRFDMLNIPSHVFGEHKCKECGRKCKDDRETEKNYVLFLKLYGLYPKIENAIKYLSIHSYSLLLNVRMLRIILQNRFRIR